MIQEIDQSFNKPNTAIVMLPKVGKLTAMSRKLLNSLFFFGQKHLQSLPKDGPAFDARDFFEADLVDVIRPIANPASNSVNMMKDHIREMQSVRVEWTSPDQAPGVVWDSMVLISQAKLKIENGKVRLMWSFPPDIVSSLADPEKFTVIRLQELAKLKTYAAVALYEIVVRYAKNPSHMTSKKPKEWWVAALSNDSHKHSLKDKSEPLLREWRMFKPEKVIPAIAEINGKTGLRIELIEFKDGKAIKDVQFSVHRVSSADFEPASDRTSPCYIQAAKLGIPQKDITVFLDREHTPFTEDHILLALAKTEARKSREDLRPLDNVASYFRSVLTEKEKLTPKLADESKKRIDPDKHTSPTVFLHPSGESKDAPVTRRSVISKEFFDLPKEDQLIYINGARERLKRRGVLSPAIIRMFDTGRWTSGIIFADILEAYGSEMHGQDWNVDLVDVAEEHPHSSMPS